jgi:hypothetical protein
MVGCIMRHDALCPAMGDHIRQREFPATLRLVTPFFQVPVIWKVGLSPVRAAHRECNPFPELPQDQVADLTRGFRLQVHEAEILRKAHDMKRHGRGGWQPSGELQTSHHVLGPGLLGARLGHPS